MGPTIPHGIVKHPLNFTLIVESNLEVAYTMGVGYTPNLGVV